MVLSVVFLAAFILLADAKFYGQSQTIRPADAPRPSVRPEDYIKGKGSRLRGRKRSGARFIGPYVARPADENVSQSDAQASGKVDRVVEGFGFDDNAFEGARLASPPDPYGAVSNSSVIAVGNFLIECRNKQGRSLWRDSLSDFFEPVSPLTDTFDPKVIYDQYEDRFVVVALELVFSDPPEPISPDNVSRILLAVSKDGSPKTPTADDWSYHAIDAKTQISKVEHWADYPGFAIDEEAVYVTTNLFSFSDESTFGGVRLWIVDKGASGGFYDGGAASVTVHNPYASVGIPTVTQPAHVFGDGGAGQNIGTYLVSYSGISNSAGMEFVQVVRVDNPLTSPTFSRQVVAVGDIENASAPLLPDAPQPGTSVVIEVNDRRALHAVWRNNSLWVTAEILPNSGPDLNQTTAHWWNLNTTAPDQIGVNDQGNIGGEDIAMGAFTYYPTVAVSKDGFAAFGFSASAPTVFPGAYVTGRGAEEPRGGVRSSELVHAGLDFFVRELDIENMIVSSRWGDYSGIAVDPANDKTFWVFNQFADGRGTILEEMPEEDGRWRMVWARYRP